MITASGRRVYRPGTPEFVGEYPSLEDIGQSLGRLVRFAGHTPTFYTVLCHTFVGLDLIEPEFAREWLIHDATESVHNDVPTTWKIRAFSELEHELLEGICREHDVPWPWSREALEAVKRVDRACMVAEAHQLGLARLTPQKRDYWGQFPVDDLVERAAAATYMSAYAGNPIRFIEPQNAVPEFLRRWKAAR